jgi:predicted nucleotidyltransferase
MAASETMYPPMQNAKFKDLTPIFTSLFRRKKQIAAAYLFGSMATGRDRRGSDIDLAIVTTKTISSRERLRLEATLSTLLRRDVDLVVFGQAAPLLQHQILKYGRLICENDPAERVRQEVQARAEYLDTRHLFREVQ